MPINLSYPRRPPRALTLNPNPTIKNVKVEVAITKMDFKRITLLYFILIDPVSFITNPIYAINIVTTHITTHTVSVISLNVFILLKTPFSALSINKILYFFLNYK